MTSSEAFQGAFEDPSKIVITINREFLEDCFQTLNFDDSIEVSEEQWKQVFKAIYESDAVSDFVGSIIEIAEDTLIEQ